MSSLALTDQELIVHVFAPADGPYADAAYEQIRLVWARCREWLGMAFPIPNTGLPVDLPATPSREGRRERALAGQQDQAAHCGMIVRRVHEVMNLSIRFAPARGADHTGKFARKDWAEFENWWTGISSGVNTIFGAAQIYQTKISAKQKSRGQELVNAVLRQLPLSMHGKPCRTWHFQNEGWVLWESDTEDEGRGVRNFAILVSPAQDDRLTEWTWSRGDLAAPVFAHYLMQCAMIRQEIRGWTGEPVERLADEVDGRLDQVHSLLREPVTGPGLQAELRRLRSNVADMTTTLTRLRKIRHRVGILVDNLSRVIGEPLAWDLMDAHQLVHQLDGRSHQLDLSLQNATVVQEIAQSLASQPLAQEQALDGPVQRGNPRHIRMGFAVDIVGYSARTSPHRDALQERLAAMLEQVAADLGVVVAPSDRQDTGDGMNVFLPPDLEVHVVLPRLLMAWLRRLCADNQAHADRMRLRMAVVLGPVGTAAIGYSGQTIVEMSRMLDSDVLRQAVRDHPGADLVTLVSDQLYRYVVGEGYPGLNPADFHKCRVEARSFVADAWLWVAK
ncbi:CATRA conflict system CASPASE/TPR repeat-associated protein [Sinosporangium siamense]|uniref:Guanylate cyclase domain-containing protein n=1 Tax=Sinosporangium siamense TaxID=1367973 RepID=A0A919RF47_9ACTN|nr:CATRA conflict system CASPASE/TPR repeat-associated protein [Sinosporangium siamense]GII92743.1 hypothetical protein Ssi02_29740 [Sinosporangium siamense]